jgi:hypothetical protein
MSVPAEVQASLMSVAGDWAMYLETIPQKNRKAAFIRLLKRQESIYAILEDSYERHTATSKD